MFEQLSGELRGGVGGEAQPPLPVGPGELDRALAAAAARARAIQGTGELAADLRLAGQRRQQLGERRA